MARDSGEIACGGNHRETPSREPFKLCMFDDIITLGLPMYHSRATETQLVALPASMANEITNSQGMRFFMPLVPSSAFWIPSPKRALVSLSGGAEMIGPVFKPVDGKDVGPLGGQPILD
jgi:PAB1-binding protein PBP1